MMNYSCEVIKFLIFILVALSIVSCSQESTLPLETVNLEEKVNSEAFSKPETTLTAEEAMFFGISTKEKGKIIIVETSDLNKKVVSSSSLNWVFLKMPTS